MSDSLRVDPAELKVRADQIASHASDFATSHGGAQRKAGEVSIGSGLASAALPQMLEQWETDGTHFGEHFARQAQGHRAAAAAYESTDEGGAEQISSVAI